MVGIVGRCAGYGVGWMTGAERIAELHAEASKLDVSARRQVQASGQPWLAIDDNMKSDFDGFLAIQNEIEQLQLECTA